MDYGGAFSSRQSLPSARKWTRDHHLDIIIENPESGVQTRSPTQVECLYHNFLSQNEPRNVDEALKNVD